MEAEGAAITGGPGVRHEGLHVVRAATEGLDQLIPTELTGVAAVGAIDRDEVQARQRGLDHRDRVTLGPFDLEPMAKVESDAEVGVVDGVRHAQAGVHALGPETGVRVERDFHAFRLGQNERLLQRRDDDGIAGGRARLDSHGQPDLLDAEPQGGVEAFERLDGLDEVGGELRGIMRELRDVVGVDEGHLTLAQLRGEGLRGRRPPTEAIVTEFGEHGGGFGGGLARGRVHREEPDGFGGAGGGGEEQDEGREESHDWMTTPRVRSSSRNAAGSGGLIRKLRKRPVRRRSRMIRLEAKALVQCSLINTLAIGQSRAAYARSARATRRAVQP